MRIHIVFLFLFGVIIPGHTQEIDINFSRNGLFLCKELSTLSSQIIDFDLTDEHKINVLFEADSRKKLVRLHKNGKKDIQFRITKSTLDNENTTPVAINSKPDGSVLVLSNFWNGRSWMISVNEFQENGNINHGFGRRGGCKKSILNNFEDNFGQNIYASSNNEIIVVAKVQQSNRKEERECIAILKLSDMGKTLSSSLYDDHYYTLNGSTMEDDYLLLAYSESVDNGLEQSTYLVGLDSHRMRSNNLHCLMIEENYQSFDDIILSNTELYTSQIQDESEGVYHIQKYDESGSIDESFIDAGDMGYNTDIYNTDFVVNQKGEIYIVSASLDNTFEIIIKKLLNTGEVDPTFGENGVASVFLRYPINNLHKIKLDQKGGLFVSGSVNMDGESFGFITRLKLNVRQLKKEKLEKFLDKLFVKN